jgi:hypothetical protein
MGYVAVIVGVDASTFPLQAAFVLPTHHQKPKRSPADVPRVGRVPVHRYRQQPTRRHFRIRGSRGLQLAMCRGSQSLQSLRIAGDVISIAFSWKASGEIREQCGR